MTSSAEPRWIRKSAVLAIHDEQLAEHGGGRGLRDDSLLEAALARPRNLFHYGDAPDLAALAAAYAYGLAKDHPFIDGNTRIDFQRTCSRKRLASTSGPHGDRHELVAHKA